VGPFSTEGKPTDSRVQREKSLCQFLAVWVFKGEGEEAVAELEGVHHAAVFVRVLNVSQILEEEPPFPEQSLEDQPILGANGHLVDRLPRPHGDKQRGPSPEKEYDFPGSRADYGY
jgi:hypothetical protein